MLAKSQNIRKVNRTVSSVYASQKRSTHVKGRKVKSSNGYFHGIWLSVLIFGCLYGVIFSRGAALKSWSGVTFMTERVTGTVGDAGQIRNEAHSMIEKVASHSLPYSSQWAAALALLDGGQAYASDVVHTQDVDHAEWGGSEDSIQAKNLHIRNIDIVNSDETNTGDHDDLNIRTRPPYAGVWVNTVGKEVDLSKYKDFIAGEADRLKWRDLERKKGEYDFSRVKTVLQRAHDRDYYWYCEFWTGHFIAPEWLFEAGVPEVMDSEGTRYGYYLDERYQKHLFQLFDRFAEYLSQLPEHLLERVAFIQPGFGSTGDRQLYKGKIKNAKYQIGAQEYLGFMQACTKAWVQAFRSREAIKQIPFLWNIDNPMVAEDDVAEESPDSERGHQKQGELLYAQWMREHYHCQLRKQQFTIAIGYMDCGEIKQDRAQRSSFYGMNTNSFGGFPEYVRGEHNDSKWSKTAMAQEAPFWHYYWTAISSVDKGLDSWETKPKYLLSDRHLDAFQFSHRYAFHKRPATSPVAFVALRDVLDYSNTQRFPESEYGKAKRSNRDRMEAILKEYEHRGAKNGDMEAVMELSTSRYLYRSKAMNDCIWEVIQRNYRRHMYQITPNETSVGFWRVGPKDQPYGRFARGFVNGEKKNGLYFKCEEGFVAAPRSIKVKVIYYDELKGSQWELRYDAVGDANKLAGKVICEGTGRWKSVIFELQNAQFSGRGSKGSDLSIVNSDDLDDKFHLIEIEK